MCNVRGKPTGLALVTLSARSIPMQRTGVFAPSLGRLHVQVDPEKNPSVNQGFNQLDQSN